MAGENVENNASRMHIVRQRLGTGGFHGLQAID